MPLSLSALRAGAPGEVEQEEMVKLAGGDWNMTFIFPYMGISSSQLTDIFQRGSNHQPAGIGYHLPHKDRDFILWGGEGLGVPCEIVSRRSFKPAQVMAGMVLGILSLGANSGPGAS